MHSTETPLEQQVLALAALLQASHLVDLVARTGTAPAESVNPLIQSLFRFDADTAAAIYNGTAGLELGLRLLRDVLYRSGGNNRQLLHYAMGMLHLQKKLLTNPEMLKVLRHRLQHAALNADHFSNNINQISSSVAAIYQDTISTFSYRIQVSGSQQQLQDPRNADLIRSLLLSGIRAAVLWRQTGGRRWHVLTRRRDYLRIIGHWLPPL